MLKNKTLIRVHVKINPKASLFNMNCYCVKVSIVLGWHLAKFNTTVAVNFSNSTCICTLRAHIAVH